MFERTKNLRLSIIKQIELEASKYPDAISLAQGIPGFDTPGCIKRRVELALKRGVVSKYSLVSGLPELRELIEISLAKENMFFDWQKEIIVTVGSIEGISATILALTKPGDEIIIPEPTYTSYQEVINLASCKPILVPLNEKNNWSFELKRFEEAITDKTKIIFYCNPNNPTGTIYTKKQLIQLAEIAEKNNIYIMTDDVYKDFIFDKEPIFSIAEVPEYRDRVIRLFSFSKVYAMTGWRIGYLHACEKLVSEILKVHDSLVTCAPVISQYAAMGALEMGEGDVVKFSLAYKKRRDQTCVFLDSLSDYLDYVRPEGTYYVFPKLKIDNTDSWKFAFDLLQKEQVAVVPGMAFGPSGEGHFRINFSRDEDDLKKAFERIKNYFKKLNTSKQ
ncbi:MAG: pyridoxal phosphate-dependent aminotransferase [Patescibacteria group bacterium]|nr:pyridoxal phosphate-dependent aminotransferase [Patescibacteria group bacterium]